jgi:hypothetical protein
VLASPLNKIYLLCGSAGSIIRFDGLRQALNVGRNYHSPMQAQMQKLVLFLALLTTGGLSAQKIEIKSDQLFLDSNKITRKTASKDFLRILGKPDREFSGYNTVWTYDRLGIKVYLKPVQLSFVSLDFDYKRQDEDFSPKKTYAGDFIINGTTISKNPSIHEFQKIDKIDFKYSVLDLYQATTPSLVLTFTYSEETKEFETTAIAFKE